VFHVRKLFHQRSVFPVLSVTRQHKLMVFRPFVEESESNLFAEPHFDQWRIEHHPLAVLQHRDLHCAGDLLRISGFARRIVAMCFMGESLIVNAQHSAYQQQHQNQNGQSS